MRRVAVIALVVVGVATAAWMVLRQRAPAIVQSLRALPEVAKVEYAGSHDAPLVVIHLRDWHHVPRELCKLEGIDFDANLSAAENVQDEQLAIARYLIRENASRASTAKDSVRNRCLTYAFAWMFSKTWITWP